MDLGNLANDVVHLLGTPGTTVGILAVAVITLRGQARQQYEREVREEARKVSAELLRACDDLWRVEAVIHRLTVALNHYIAEGSDNRDFQVELADSLADNRSQRNDYEAAALSALHQIRITVPQLEDVSRELIKRSTWGLEHWAEMEAPQHVVDLRANAAEDFLREAHRVVTPARRALSWKCSR